MSRTIHEVMETLKSLGSESRRKTNMKNGVGENQFGVLMGPMRALAKEIGIDHDLAMDLWKTGNTDAMLLSCMTMDASQLSPNQAEAMITPLTYSQLIDEFSFTALPLAPWAADKMQEWMNSSHPTLGRVGSCSSTRSCKKRSCRWKSTAFLSGSKKKRRMLRSSSNGP